MITAALMPDTCPFWERHVTLGRVLDGKVEHVLSIEEKRAVLRDHVLDRKSRGAIFFVAWTGQWTTSLFLVSEEQLELLERLDKKVYTGRPGGLS